MTDKSFQILAAVLKGGLVVSGRNTGKTKALAIIAALDPKARIVYGVVSQRGALARLMSVLGLSEEQINERLISVEKTHRMPELNDFNVYVDEQVITQYPGRFKAAVTSFSCPVTIIE